MREYLYENRLKSERTGKEYLFETSDGVPSKDSFREAELLLADTVKPEPDEDILILYCGYGFLGIFEDYTPEGKTVLMESSDRAYRISKHNLELNSIENAECRLLSSPEKLDENFDKVVYAPQPYWPIDSVKKRISEAVDLLKEEGALIICSTKQEGLKRYRDWLKRFNGELERLNHRNSYQVYRYTKKGHFETQKPSIHKNYEAEVEGVRAEFETVKGVFSPEKLDEGSRILIKNTDLNEGERVWDVCCGYGAIGIFLKKIYDCDIYLSDDDALSVELAEKNLQKNGIESYELENAECLECFQNSEFDFIVSNPPTHQGKAVTTEIFEESHDRLKQGGSLCLVFNQNMNYENQLSGIFKEVEILDKKSNFLVVRARK